MPIDVTGTGTTVVNTATVNCPFCHQDTHKYYTPVICPGCSRWINNSDLPKAQQTPTIDCPHCKQDSRHTSTPFVCAHCNKWVTVLDLTKEIAPSAPVPEPVCVGIACPHCKFDTEITPDEVMVQFPIKDLVCPSCTKMIFSSRPEIKAYSYTYNGGNGIWDD